MKWINEHWQLIAGLAAATVFVVAQSIAYGEQVQRIKTMEQAIQAQAQQQATIIEVKSKQERIDERTKLILEMMKGLREDLKGVD